MVSRPILFDNITEVSEIFNFVLILLDKATVSLPILELNIAAVSALFNFQFDNAAVSAAFNFKFILVANVAESAFNFEIKFCPFINKFESINTFPFANNESFTIILPLTNKLESILAPLDITSESLNFNPESNCNLPPTLSPPLTYKLESINTFALANSESVIVDLPLTNNEESILALSLSALRLILLDKVTVSLKL